MLSAATLRALCEAATPGPWVQWNGHADVYAGAPKVNTRTRIGGYRGQVASCDHRDFDEDEQDHANAAYIAAASPDVVIALLDRVAEAERRAEEAQEARDAAGAHADSVEDRLRSQKAIAEAAEAKLARLQEDAIDIHERANRAEAKLGVAVKALRGIVALSGGVYAGGQSFTYKGLPGDMAAFAREALAATEDGT